MLPTAWIADDVQSLRDVLARPRAWARPQLAIVAQVRSGREAVEQFEVQQLDTCFATCTDPA